MRDGELSTGRREQKFSVVFSSHSLVEPLVKEDNTWTVYSHLVKTGVVMKRVILGVLGALTITSSAYADQYGIATYYFHPRYPNSLIAAHKTLPLGTRVRVHDLDNGRHVDVTIVDRGPFAGPSRIIDLSTVAANVLGIRSAGICHVRVERL